MKRTRTTIPRRRFCIDWFQAFGVADGKSGDAISMANAYNLGLSDLEQAGVFYAKGGVARLLKRSDLPVDWHPSTDKHLTHWECAQHLIRILEAKDGGEASAARLVAAINPEDAGVGTELAYVSTISAKRKDGHKKRRSITCWLRSSRILKRQHLNMKANVGQPRRR